MKKKFAVILSGCGVYDGSEIHEAVMTLLAIDINGAEYEIFAPDIDQYHTINHLIGKPEAINRNVLVESARIARGKIKEISNLTVQAFDAIVFPGGFGAAKNLSTYAFDGDKMKVLPEVEQVIREAYKQKKFIGALCISPVLIAKVLGNGELTLGQPNDAVKVIQKLGARHKETQNGEIVVDMENKIVTTPCYMLNATVADIFHGADAMVKAIVKYSG